MELTLDEQRLIAEFRKMPITCRDELMSYASSLLRRTSSDEPGDPETASNQCGLKVKEKRAEIEKTPIFTE